MSGMIWRARSLWRALRRRSALDAEMEEEFRAHLELRAEDLVRSGLSPEEALRRARLEFGSVDRYREEGRESRGLRLFDELRGDVRYAVRSLRRSPAFAAASVLTLALGIGASTAVFSVVNAVLLRQLPFARPDRLVAIWPERLVGNREIEFLRANSRSLVEVGSFSPGWLMALTGVERPAQLEAGRLSGNLFRLLGARAELGRTFGMEAESPGAAPVAVLSDAVWRTQFGADPGIVGRTIVLDREPHVVVGVMPPEFQVLGQRSDLWTQLPMDPEGWTYGATVTLGVGRLAPAATLAGANAELTLLVPRMRAAFGAPESYGEDATIRGLKEATVGRLRPMLLVLLGAVAFIVLIAAANVANLLLVRASDRRVEFAVRGALGASRPRLARQLVTESLTLAAAGGAVGLAAAYLGVRGLRAWLPADTPRLTELRVDGAVLMAAAATTIVTGLLFALAPVLAEARDGVQRWLRAGRTASRGGRRAHGALVAAEVALAVVLLAGALLMVRTVAALSGVDPGFRPERVLTLRIQPSESSEERRVELVREVLARIAALPGVEAVGSVLHLPMSGRSWTVRFEVEGRPTAPGAPVPSAAWEVVAGEYFRAMGVRLLRGRALAAIDRADSPPVAVVNQAFARRYLSGPDPVGRRIRTGNPEFGPWMTVVGVVGDMRHDSLSVAPEPTLYLPYAQAPIVANSIVVRTSGDARRLARPAEAAIRTVDRDIPVSQVMTMPELVARSIARPRLVRALLGMFAATGVLLAIVGIYGVVAYGARQRSKEIGIRMALGAPRRSVIRLVVGEGVAWAAAGTAVGLLAALALSRAMRTLVFGVSPTDPLTFALVPALLLAVTLAASWLPARRASGVGPTEVLRE